jgi:hypothetical protein
MRRFRENLFSFTAKVLSFIGNDRHYKLIFFVLSATLVLAYGLNVWLYAHYNLSRFIFIQDSSLFQNAYFSKRMLSNFLLYNLSFLYLSPVFYIVGGILLKTMVFYLVYKISLFFLKDKRYAFITSLYFVISSTYFTHGITCNSLWTGVFGNTLIASVLVLWGTYFLFRGQNILFALFTVVAVQLHALYALAVVMFVVPGILFLVLRGRKSFSEYIIPACLILPGLVYIIFIGKVEVASLKPLGINAWWYFNYFYNFDDVGLVYTFFRYGIVLVPLFVAAQYLCVKNVGRSKEDYIMFSVFTGAMLLIVFVLSHELLLFAGYNLGSLSEYLIKIQLRRGIWLPALLALITIFRSLSKTRNFEKAGYFIPLLLFLNIYLHPDAIYSGIFYVVLMICFFNRKTVFLFILYIFFLLIYFLSGGYVRGDKLTLWFFYMFMASGLSLMAFKYLPAEQNHLKMLFPVFFMVLSLVLYGVYNGVFIRDFRLLFSNGFFRSPDIANIVPQSEDKLDIAKALKRNNKAGLLVLVPVSDSSYFDRIIFGAPLFADKMSMAYLGQYSRHYCRDIMGKIKFLFRLRGIDEVYGILPDFSAGSEGKRRIDALYMKIPWARLLKLRERYGVELLVTERKYDRLKLIHKNSSYFLYSLNPEQK